LRRAKFEGSIFRRAIFTGFGQSQYDMLHLVDSVVMSFDFDGKRMMN
jgi:hypothetical protein